MISDDKLKQIGEVAIKYVSPFITTITGVMKDQNISPVYIGTGCYLNFNKHTYILSAKHVADNLSTYDYLFEGGGELMHPIQGHWVATDIPEADTAVMGCFPELLTNDEKILDYKDTLFSSNHSEDTYYLVLGYPGKLHTNLDFMKQHQHVSISLLTKLQSVNTNKNGDDILFKLHYSKDNVVPPGISGSPVWNLNVNDKTTEWDVSKITFAGIVTRWHEGDQTILVTNAELVKHVLPTITNKFRELYPRDDK